MSSGKLFCAVSLLTVLGTISETAAGNRALECYERTRTEPVYDTVYENVEVNPGYSRVETVPAIYGTRRRTVVVREESVGYRTIPAEYAWQRELVEIEPARQVARVVPARTRTVYHKVKVDDGGYAWEWRWIDGRRVLCKVRRQARYERVAETVVVREARTVYETVPAQYGYRKHRVLVSPAYTESYVIPAKYETVEEQVVIQPEVSRVVEVDPSYQRVARRVLVEEGTESWRRVHIARHCGG
jgi:hypothetical protein